MFSVKAIRRLGKGRDQLHVSEAWHDRAGGSKGEFRDEGGDLGCSVGYYK